MTVATNASVMTQSRRWLFIATICTGSFLLFLVQPMIARIALPILGGAPAVWNSAMLVYQALLLVGYAYAHWLGRLAPKRQAMLHLGVFVVAAIMLPIGLRRLGLPVDANPVFWVPWLLLSSIGPLFFVVSAQAPLMQRWFADAGGGDPYRLYAASNLGSFAGLIAYPLLVEPLLPIAGQRWLWSAGYVLLIALVAGCAFALPSEKPAAMRSSVEESGGEAGSFWWWVLVAAIPSGLMLSTTIYLTTDIVAMPLLWVLPLGIYLLSFSFAFSDRPRMMQWIALILPILLIGGSYLAFAGTTGHALLGATYALGLLGLICVSLHGRLYQTRPAPEHLTRFYLAMSVGGAAGGVFCALLAPLVFNWGYEHPILLLAAALIVPRWSNLGWVDDFWEHHGDRLSRWLPLIAFLLSLLVTDWVFAGGSFNARRIFACALIVLICLVCRSRRWPFAISLAALMLAAGGWEKLNHSFLPGVLTRSYFGIYSVYQEKGEFARLAHGTTTHGIQNQTPGHERDPLSYYVPDSGVGIAMRAVPSIYGNKAHVGFVGLGAGTLACYAQPGQTWRIYEIDPAIRDIATDPERFTFLSNCLPKADIAIGDARLVLANEPAGQADVLAVDAFSSDAIPMHLMTRDAFATYGRYLKPNGMLIVHISNRFIDLEPVVAGNLGKDWHGLVRMYEADKEALQQQATHSIWIVMSRDPAVLEKLKTFDRKQFWYPLKPRANFQPWTDDYASILPVLRTPWHH